MRKLTIILIWMLSLSGEQLLSSEDSVFRVEGGFSSCDFVYLYDFSMRCEGGEIVFTPLRVYLSDARSLRLKVENDPDYSLSPNFVYLSKGGVEVLLFEDWLQGVALAGTPTPQLGGKCDRAVVLSLVEGLQRDDMLEKFIINRLKIAGYWEVGEVEGGKL